MGNQIPEDLYRILARERSSHEDARHTLATNRMLVQSLIMVNGGPARIEIRFDPHRTNTLQLALPSHVTRRRFEYQMQVALGGIVALATRRCVLVASGETGLRN